MTQNIDSKEKIKKTLNIQFIKIMPFAAVLSIILFVFSISLFIYRVNVTGFNMGIDFAGGVELKVHINNPSIINISEMRDLYTYFENENSVNIQELEGANNINSFLLRFKGSNEESQNAIKVLIDKYGTENVDLIGNTIISGVVSSDNLRLAFILIIVSWIIIMIYITIRFDVRYALPAIITLVHNIAIVFGVLLILNKEFSILILSSMLTLIGYTINDIIVVFDRIRENTYIENVKPFKEIVNISLNQVVGRTIMTSLSTMIAAGAIMIWGGSILYNFAFTFFVGVVVGTYASNFIASGLLILFMRGKKFNN